jgi:hypothetical protein
MMKLTNAQVFSVSKQNSKLYGLSYFIHFQERSSFPGKRVTKQESKITFDKRILRVSSPTDVNNIEKYTLLMSSARKRKAAAAQFTTTYNPSVSTLGTALKTFI